MRCVKCDTLISRALQPDLGPAYGSNPCGIKMEYHGLLYRVSARKEFRNTNFANVKFGTILLLKHERESYKYFDIQNRMNSNLICLNVIHIYLNIVNGFDGGKPVLHSEFSGAPFRIRDRCYVYMAHHFKL